MADDNNAGAVTSNPASNSAPVFSQNNASSPAGRSNRSEKLIIVSALIIVVVVAAVILLSISNNHTAPQTTVGITHTASTSISTSTATTTATTVPSTVSHEYLGTIYYSGRNITIYPGSSASVSFTVPANVPTALLTGAFSVKEANVTVEAAVLNSTEYVAFEANPSSIVSDKGYLGFFNSKNISVNLTPGTYSLTFFNTNATSGAKYNIAVTNSIALYT